MTTYDKIYIGGSWVPSTGSGTIDVIDSVNEDVMATIPAGTAADVDGAVQAARQAFDAWSTTSVEERGKYLTRIGEALGARMDEIATVISRETGMVKGLSKIVQVGLPMNSFNSAARVVEQFAFEEQVGNSLVVREPIGVVGCITPWNYPLHQIAAKVAYALAAGCTVVLKPSEIAPVDAFILAEVIHEIGLPAGVFNLVSGDGPTVGEAIASHPGVDMVSFTGSTRAGRRVAQLAAETMKKVALELGGKSANVLLDDLDEAGFAKAVADGVGKCFLNSGQTCSALTRMLVPRSAGRGREGGGGNRGDVRRGRPLRRDIQARAAGFRRTAPAGARLRGEGDRGRGQARRRWSRGARGSRQGLLRAAHRVLRRATGHDDRPGGDLRSGALDPALRHRGRRGAHRQRHGVRARRRVWSADKERAKRVARRLRTGQVEVNGGPFNPNAPFGGYKQSGVGREYGRHGLEEFLE